MKNNREAVSHLSSYKYRRCCISYYDLLGCVLPCAFTTEQDNDVRSNEGWKGRKQRERERVIARVAVAETMSN